MKGGSKPQSGDSDVPKSSPLSAQDLKSGVSQDMPVSSTAFPWSSGEPHSSVRSGDSLSEIVPGSLADWTHFDPGLHHSSENDPQIILKDLLTPLKNDPFASDTVLKHLLNDKTSDDSNKQLRLLLAENLAENGSPLMYHDQSLMNSFLPNHVDMNQNASVVSGKRKIEEIDGAEPGNMPKLAEKNKMLAELLQNTTKQQTSDGRLPVPNPGDLPQNKLPKDLSNRILAPPGRVPLPGTHGIESGYGLDDLTHRPCDPPDNTIDAVLEHLLEDLERPGGNDSLSSVFTPEEQQAIDAIKVGLYNDVSMNGPLSMQSGPASYREPSIPSPMTMGPRYTMMQNPAMVRTSMNVYANNADGSGMMMQRMPGGTLMLQGQMSTPSRPGMPSDFNASRSPVPPSGTSSNTQLKQHLRMQAWQRQMRAGQLGQAGMGQPPSLQVSGNPVNLQRSLSIPSPSGSSFPVNGFQNVPQSHQFTQQQSVPYSPPPQPGLRFPVQTSAQPVSPRHPNPQVSGRMMRPGMWPQQSQISGMGAVGAPQSPHPLQSNNSMSMAAVAQQQQNPPPYSTQQFISQNNGQQFSLPAHMMTQNPNQPTMPSRMTPAGGGAGGGGGLPASQFSQQGTMQQDGFGSNPGMYQRNLTPGMQSRMVSPNQNQQLLRNTYSNLSEDMRANDGSFGSYQMNGGISSAPPNLNSQQQFRWDIGSGDRSNSMQITGAPNLLAQNVASRMAAPTLSMDSYSSYDFFNEVDTTSNGLGGGHTPQGHHVNEQQFRPMYTTDGQGVMSQHMNQSYAQAPELMGVNRPGNSPVHQHLAQPPGDRKSLLQELLSQNSG